eukprot:gene57168-biopygen107387
MGGEAFVHAVRQWCERHRDCPDAVMCLLDWRNAFQGVCRRTFLEESRELLPSIYAWTRWCYGQPSRLLFGHHVIWSRAGAQQGDPLAGLLFALVLRVLCTRVGLPVVARAVAQEDALARASAPLVVSGSAQDIAGFYLDDGSLGGSSAKVVCTFEGLCKEGPRLGLNFGRKCKVIRPCARSTVAAGLFPDFVQCLPPGGGIALLKSPIGDRGFCEQHTQARVDALVPTLEELQQLPDPHVAFRLLVVCCSSARMSWTVRTTPLTRMTDAGLRSDTLATFDGHVRHTFEKITSFALQQQEWDVAMLPTRQGGVGLRSTLQHADAAYVSSRRSTFELCCTMDPNFCWEASRQPAGVLATSIQSLNARLPPGKQLTLTDNTPVKQHTLSASLEAVQYIERLKKCTPGDRAHLRAKSAPHAGALLTGVPAPSLGLWLEPDEFRIVMHLWLGVPVCEEESRCNFCAMRVGGGLPDIGEHALRCKGGGDIVHRHDQLRDIWWRLCKAAGLRPEIEKPGLLPGTMYRPADIWLYRYPGGGPAKIALDQKVVDPLQRKYMVAAGQVSLAAAEAYADYAAERHDCERECAARGIHFIPVVAEAYGGWGFEAQKALKAISEARASRAGMSPAQSLEYAYQSLAVSLWRSNARAVLARLAQPTDDQSPFANATKALTTERTQRVIDEEDEQSSEDGGPAPLERAAAQDDVQSQAAFPTHPAGIDASRLSRMSQEQQKNLLGAELLKRVPLADEDLAAKVTGQLLERDNWELLNLLDQPDLLAGVVAELAPAPQGIAAGGSVPPVSGGRGAGLALPMPVGVPNAWAAVGEQEPAAAATWDAQRPAQVSVTLPRGPFELDR